MLRHLFHWRTIRPCRCCVVNEWNSNCWSWTKTLSVTLCECNRSQPHAPPPPRLNWGFVMSTVSHPTDPPIQSQTRIARCRHWVSPTIVWKSHYSKRWDSKTSAVPLRKAVLRSKCFVVSSRLTLSGVTRFVVSDESVNGRALNRRNKTINLVLWATEAIRIVTWTGWYFFSLPFMLYSHMARCMSTRSSSFQSSSCIMHDPPT